jgi:hypothetical protein
MIKYFISNSKKISNILVITIIFLLFSSNFILSKAYSEKNINSLEIILDYAQTNGIIKPFSEINCGPLPNHDVKNAFDLTDDYKDIGISFIRTHDFSGPTDISWIFPDLDADPTLQSSYDFSKSDIYISSIIDAGCSVFYRLGESASDNEKLRTPPKNASKWAEICKHIVMHYNEGWSNGYFYNITHWEIWNEPDLTGFWNGTAEQYYYLYHETAETLKNYNSSLKIGGPCTSSLSNDNFTNGFLTYITENNLSLDFYSWHQYADSPDQFFDSSSYVRFLLDSYGLTDCENINTEWNINIIFPQRDKDNSKNAAFTSCALACFQDSKLDYSFRYRGTQDPNWLMRLVGFDLSLFTSKGVYKKPTLSFLAHNYLTRDSPIRLRTPVMDASNGITYLAGKSIDNSDISIIISNFHTDDTNYNLELSNLPWDSSFIEAIYLIDNSHNFEIIEQNTLTTNIYETSHTLEKNSVHFIRLTNSTSIPDEGPDTARIPFILRLKILDPFTRFLGIFLLILIFS